MSSPKWSTKDGVTTLNLDKLLPKMEAPKAKTFVELGNIMLRESGPAACQRGYGTTDPEWVGRYARQYNDINADGTLN